MVEMQKFFQGEKEKGKQKWVRMAGV